MSMSIDREMEGNTCLHVIYCLNKHKCLEEVPLLDVYRKLTSEYLEPSCTIIKLNCCLFDKVHLVTLLCTFGVLTCTRDLHQVM